MARPAGRLLDEASRSVEGELGTRARRREGTNDRSQTLGSWTLKGSLARSGLGLGSSLGSDGTSSAPETVGLNKHSNPREMSLKTEIIQISA
jgi:hypothetical protein